MENNNKHPILKILLLDIGVAGSAIFGALGIIAIAFILLNYFNILSLSDLYPQLLSFLPKQQSKIALQGVALQGETLQPHYC